MSTVAWPVDQPGRNVAEDSIARGSHRDDLHHGGAVDAPGNIASSGSGIANDVAEWNMYVDPHAASIVFASGAPITLVPLDATNFVKVTPTFYDRLTRNHSTPEASFVYDLYTSIARSTSRARCT